MKQRRPTKEEWIRLEKINQAIDEYRNGHVISSKCPVCNEILSVSVVKEINSTWVNCPNGCTKYHAQGYRDTKSD